MASNEDPAILKYSTITILLISFNSPLTGTALANTSFTTFAEYRDHFF